MSKLEGSISFPNQNKNNLDTEKEKASPPGTNNEMPSEPLNSSGSKNPEQNSAGIINSDHIQK